MGKTTLQDPVVYFIFDILCRKIWYEALCGLLWLSKCDALRGRPDPGAICHVYFRFLPVPRGHAVWRLRNPVFAGFCRIIKNPRSTDKKEAETAENWIWFFVVELLLYV